MSTKSALLELRRKRQYIERAIRALELLQQLEDNGTSTSLPSEEDSAPSKVVEFPNS